MENSKTTPGGSPLPIADGGNLRIALDGFEGPIDLLLSLAREQKVDLSSIAIAPLAEQYLAYLTSAHALRLEIAADYLVMAAWLAFLKSRILLPESEVVGEQPDPDAMAEALRFQLARLEAMQKASLQIQALPQLGSEVFVRGIPEPVEVEIKPEYYLPLQDFLAALSAPLRRRKPPAYHIPEMRLFSLEESVGRLRRVLGYVPNWASLEGYLPDVLNPEEVMEFRSAVASTFAASLELVKNGELEIRQDGTFAPIFMRKREASMLSDSRADHNEGTGV